MPGFLSFRMLMSYMVCKLTEEGRIKIAFRGVVRVLLS